MNGRFEGLNLPQLLDLLHPPVMPDPIPWLPQTLGWQIVGLWALTVVLLVVEHLRGTWLRDRYRREALDRLRAIAAAEHDAETPGRIAVLLKRTALAAYPRAQVANLWGDGWADFLVTSSKGDRRVRKAASALASAAYRDDIEAAELIAPARRWIRVHLV